MEQGSQHNVIDVAVTWGDDYPLLATQVPLEAIRRTIRRHVNEVRYCYERALAQRPELGGRVSVMFLIQPDGHVGSARLSSSSMGSAQVEDCIVSAVRRWTFPQPHNGGVVSVTYPFMLQSRP